MDVDATIEIGFLAWYLAMLVLGMVSLGLLCQRGEARHRCRTLAAFVAATIVSVSILMLAYFGMLFAVPSLSLKPISYCPGEAAGFWMAVVVSCVGIVLGVALMVRWLLSRS